ncbi:MAG: MarR family transcriptional regulator [Pseudooceanicola sp.]
MATRNRIAVLTGDLVASTRLDRAGVAGAMEALSDQAGLQAGWHGAPLRFSRHRGDGWQVALARPDLALASALGFRACLRALDDELDSYIAIAEGPAPERIEADLNRHSEAVFVASGRALDTLKDMGEIRMTHASGGAVAAATVLADHASHGWTRAQAQAILPALAPDFDGTQTSIAESLGKSRQAVGKSMKAGGYEFINAALQLLREKEARSDDD